MNLFQICGVCVLCAIASIILKHLGQGYEKPILLACLLLLATAFVARIEKNNLLTLYMEDAGFGEYLPALFKGLGICIAVEISAALCKESGAESAGRMLQWIGKAEILLLALPLVRELMEMAGLFLR